MENHLTAGGIPRLQGSFDARTRPNRDPDLGSDHEFAEHRPIVHIRKGLICVRERVRLVYDRVETGEIAVRGFPSSFLEYWERPEKTGDSRIDDWILTDDLAKRDEDGYFWFEGRADDVILSSGYRIGPFDIESTLVEHDAVTEAAVVGVPDEQRGQLVKAFLVPPENVEPTDEVREDIQSHVRERLAAHEYPREIEFVEELPKTVTGKIRRTELREE